MDETSSQQINPRQVEKFILDHISNIELKANTREVSAPDLEFSNNYEFWNYVFENSNRTRMQNITLNNFRISTWYPRVPGVAHTTDGTRLRAEARRFLISRNSEVFFNPTGKSRMVQGGIGSVKFQPIELQGEDFWLCTATSDSLCHTGIPIFIPNSIYNNIDISMYNDYIIRGRTKFLPKIIEYNFKHYTKIPKLYIHVESITRSNSRNYYDPINITPVVYFKSNDLDYVSEDLVTFVKCEELPNLETERIFDWFLNYTRMYDGQIITNFDEQCPLFDNAPFSLQRLMSEQITIGEVKTMIIQSSHTNIKATNMNSNNGNISLGNNNTVNGNIVAAQSITNSFKTIEKISKGSEMQMLLKEFEETVKHFVENAEDRKDANAIARDTKSFCEEISSEDPRTDTLQNYLESIGKVALKAGALGSKVITIISDLSPLLKVIGESSI